MPWMFPNREGEPPNVGTDQSGTDSPLKLRCLHAEESVLITDETIDLTNAAGWSASLSLYDAFIASADCHGVNSYGAGADATKTTSTLDRP